MVECKQFDCGRPDVSFWLNSSVGHVEMLKPILFAWMKQADEHIFVAKESA